MKTERGMTLLEVLVASVIMATAVVGLLTSLNTSMRNAGRLTDHDRATLLGRAKLDELLATDRLPTNTLLTGAFDAGSGWRARVTLFDAMPSAPVGTLAQQRIELEIWWQRGEARRSLTLEGFRITTVKPGDVPGGGPQVPLFPQ